MPRPTPELTEEEKFKLQEQQEQELTRLQRQYNHLEKDRQLFTCGFKLLRLNKILSIYKKEHLNIEVDLEVASAPAKKRQDNKDSDCLSKRLEDYDVLGENLQKERQYIAEIQEHIKKAEKKVVSLRSQQITDRQHEDRVWAAITTVGQLMNKLEVQNQKFGTLCSKNRDLKLEIRRMLWERDIFMKIWDKLINKLVMGKKFMMDLIEQATIAYDQRELWYSKLQALRLKAHGDLIAHTNEMRELKRKQDQNKKLEHFHNIKQQKRIMRDLLEKEKFKRLDNKMLIKRRLSEYQQHMEDIREFAQESQVKNIARTWYTREAENFSLFNHVNNLQEELEFLNDQLFQIRGEITTEQELEDFRSEKRATAIENLEIELEGVANELETTEKDLRETEMLINFMLAGIDNLFKICKCDKDPIMQLLGDNTEITIFTVMLYVEMIEKKIHAALIDVFQNEKIAFDKRKITATERLIWEDSTKEEIRTCEKSHLSSPCPLCIGHELISDVVVNLQHAMTRDEVKVAVAERKQTPEYLEHVHNVSACFLPESREIIQRRFQ